MNTHTAPQLLAGNLWLIEIQGAPEVRDTALLHVPSRTLILTELVFRFAGDEPIWTRHI